MVRRFFRDSAIYFIPAALSSGMSFFMFPFYAHHFNPRQYGVLDLLALAAMLVGWTVALQIYQAIGRFVSGEKDLVKARSYSSTGLLFATAAYAVFALVAELLSVPISHVLLGADVRVLLLRVAIPLACVQGVLVIVQAQLRWQLRPVSYAAGAIINAVLTVVFSALLVFAARLGVEGAILGQLIGAGAALAYALVATRGSFRLHFDRARCREMLSYSAPLVPSAVGVFLNLYADRLVIQHLRSLYEVGLYGVGYRLAMIVSLLLFGIQGAAMPLILSRKDEPSTPTELAKILRLFTALALSALVVLSLLATPALRILAAAKYQSASSVVPFLVIAVLLAGMYVFAPGISIAKKTVLMAAITIAGGLVNVVLALLLVPPFGITGAGIATAASSVLWFAALMMVSQRFYPAPHDWQRLLTAFAAVVTFVGVAMVLLPSDRGRALAPGLVGIRLLLVISGVALSIWLAAGHDAAAALQARLATRRGIRLDQGHGVQPTES